MAYENIAYKSYCWSFGTTSFRTRNFNYKIEKQLFLLNDFWYLEINQNVDWNGNNILQASYYDFMKQEGFVEGEANNKPKDAREKTSGLKDLGLITEDRKLTDVGLTLLEISSCNDYTSDNRFKINKDSFIYLKQMLKVSCWFESEPVRPFIVLLYLLCELEYLTTEEFTYLLPLCINENATKLMISNIKRVRNNEISVDDVIVETLLNMNNYKEAKCLLMDNTASEELICTVGFNRKSRSYDKPYYQLFLALKDVFLNKRESEIINLYNKISKVTIGIYWRNLLFDTTNSKAIKNDPLAHLKNSKFSSIKNEDELKSVFFEYMHLFKAKATLRDYFDLNKRYIKNTDIVLFIDNQVKLDIIPKYFFESVIDILVRQAFTESDKLHVNCSLSEIDSCLVVNDKNVIEAVNISLGSNVSTIDEAQNIIENERYSRLHTLIEAKFSDDVLIELLDLFEKRNDDRISALVTDNADIPTIFEYVLGIIWYKISDRQGKILDFMNLSLEADLLPKTHAGGGEADIVYEYDETEYYPKHSLLIEATLANSTTQRSMEMEPVSRHLGQHLLKTGNLNSYCVFATNFLNINVISDFRNRKTMTWYDTRDTSKYIEGMKIIPIQTSEIKSLLENKVRYKAIYGNFEEAFKSNLPAHEWYESCIRP